MGATRQFTTFEVESMLFGVDVAAVQEVAGHQLITPVPLAPVAGTGLINLRGQVVTAIDLRSRLGLEPRVGRPMNVVVRVDNQLVSLLVDAIGDAIEVGAEQFEPSPRTVAADWADLIDGGYKLEGRVLLVLDVARAVGLDLA
jgi:purine-binding chemotaxis protein CheW